MTEPESIGALPLPPGIRSRFVDDVNGLRVHVLEAGYESEGRPCVLLLHGFPELAFSWRKVMPQLAAAGYHVIAPDQRGYGRTTGWDADYDGDLGSFRLLNLVRDALGVVAAFGYHHVDAVVGHDFGSSVAAWCALVRPDVFRAVALMSAPFSGPPPLPFGIADAPQPPKPEDPVHRELAALPRPRKHYQWYYATREANADMRQAPQGLHDFLRGYYHHKSADWAANAPSPLAGWTATELAKLPTYYVMDLIKTMAQTVAEQMPSPAAACGWLPDDELAVYAGEYARTGFQGGLQWYRCGTSGAFLAELETYAGRRIDVPSCFIAGKQDWGTYQRPGAFEAMQSTACSNMIGCDLIDGAGHWVQQEQPDEVSRLLLRFLDKAATGSA
ncbi:MULTISPECIES: alpha/beta hydrolase [Rhodopseudomonas]|uniref:Alpha/beta hydrolase n=1 Tax=Rhodopseudomonas palustris TaxID=1076 RepID=A0A0D7E2J0_RHOPL|nr:MULTISPECIES: alpha/beta hydrolase [Rhodopseudomonas]KIZ35084.1 alpha/beta hydrolase [Rhodopseudomonas palustris]MDF3812212.1 alpha/beta hydrolase [Rhodopseudomonas sp. BAL398]WOK18081.1 alpha/beta hydrolase [Rhodopseudomonas sp. BAL398]